MKSETCAIAKINKSENSVLYFGFNSKNELKWMENPASIKTCFSHDDAAKIVAAMRKSGQLNENETLRAKAITQCVRDYCGKIVEMVKNTVVAGDEKVDKVLENYPEAPKPEKVKKEEKKVEDETTEEKVEEVAEEPAPETIEEN